MKNNDTPNKSFRNNNKLGGLIRRGVLLLMVWSVCFAAYGQDSKQTGSDNLFAAALAIAQKRCVKIYGAGIRTEAGYATGLIISPDGKILTAHGIYFSGRRLRVVLPDGAIHNVNLNDTSDKHKIHHSVKLQAVVFEIDAKTPDYFQLPEKLNIKKGDWVLSVSNLFKVADGPEPLSVNLGVMSLRAELDIRHRTQDVPYEGDILLIDAITSNPGAPGGAVIDVDGNLVGMVGKLLQSKSTNTRLNYVVPADRLTKFVKHPEEEKVVHNPPPEGKKGVTGIRLLKSAGRRNPAYIDRVKRRSAAAKAGLKSDDLILAIDNEVIRDVYGFDKIAKTFKPGQQLTFVIKRKNRILSITVEADVEK